MSNAPDPRRRPPAVKTLDHTVAAVPLLQGRVLLHEHPSQFPGLVLPWIMTWAAWS